jgi:hypothetical protein
MKRVTILIEMTSRPQLIAPQGRWTFRLQGRNFVLLPHHGRSRESYSRDGTERRARRMARDLGLRVNKQVLVQE